MKRLLTSALALSLLAGSAAMAQPGPGFDRDHRGPSDHGHGDRGPGGWRDDHRGPHFDERGGHFRYGRGDRLPPDYRRYEVRDWQARHLRPPPRGYYWTRVDNDYVLAAATTGIVASIIAATR